MAATFSTNEAKGHVTGNPTTVHYLSWENWAFELRSYAFGTFKVRCKSSSFYQLKGCDREMHLVG